MNNERNYEPCPFKNGSCFSSVIKNDLKLFQTGLTKDTFLIMKTRLIYYLSSELIYILRTIAVGCGLQLHYTFSR